MKFNILKQLKEARYAGAMMDRPQNERYRVEGYGNNWRVRDEYSGEIVDRFVSQEDAWDKADELEAADEQHLSLMGKHEEEEAPIKSHSLKNKMKDFVKKPEQESNKEVFKQRKEREELPEELPDDEEERQSFLARHGITDDDERSDIEIANDMVPQTPKSVDTNLPATIETLPDIVNKNITKRAPIKTNWNQISNLPGYMKAAIRTLGRQIFKTFTTTEVEDIQVLANFGLSANEPNSKREMAAVAGWLRDDGERRKDSETHFKDVMPDEYEMGLEVYDAEDFTFMFVNDDYGNYIYAWPSADNKH